MRTETKNIIQKNIFHSVDEAIKAIKNGEMVIVADDEDRENEGDLVCAAEKVTPEIINFMSKEGRGLICLTLEEDIAKKLELNAMVPNNSSKFGTAFTVSIDASSKHGVTTGISAKDRSKTIEVALKDDTKPKDLNRPGHIFPLVAKTLGATIPPISIV